MKIGVENFRVFKEMTEFEIRPLTLLIGPNNSGKSSFTKLLLLLKNGIKNLNFKEDNHYLGSYQDTLNWELKNEIQGLRIPNNFEWLSEEFYVEIHRNYHNESGIFSIVIKNDFEDIMFSLRQHQNMYKLSINIDLIIDLIYDKRLTYFCDKDEVNNKSYIFEEYAKSDSKIKSLTFEHLSLFKKELEDVSRFSEYFAIMLVNEINTLLQDNPNGVLYQIRINEVDLPNAYKEDIRNLQTDFFNNVPLPYNILNDPHLINIPKDIIPQVNSLMKESLKDYFSKELSVEKKNIQVSESPLGRLLFNIHKIPLPFGMGYDEYCIFDYFKEPFKDSLFKEVDYVGANRGSKEHTLYDNEINKIYADFFNKYQSKDEQQAYKAYLNDSLKIFGIKGEIIVKRFENLVSSVFVQFKDEKKGNNGQVPLNKLGFGLSQLFPLLLKALASDKSGSRLTSFPLNDSDCYYKDITLIIEEPEANLHPLLQSKLADFFALTIQYFPFIRLVIETHSEYLVRKLQILVSQNKLANDKVIIHYFNSDENVNINEPKVKKIEIDSAGQLTDTFGRGFFDESADLRYELMKYNNKSRLN